MPEDVEVVTVCTPCNFCDGTGKVGNANCAYCEDGVFCYQKLIPIKERKDDAQSEGS